MVQPDLRAFLDSWAQELAARSNRVRQLIGSAHWLSDGHHKEYIVRDFLQRYLPSDLLVSRGFIRPLTDSQRCSNELDILISAPAVHPPLFNEGALQIVTPRAVLGHLEVKTRCNPTSLRDAFQCQASAQALADGPQARENIWRGVVFFETDESIDGEKAMRWLSVTIEEAVCKVRSERRLEPDPIVGYLPKSVVINEDLVAFLRRGEASNSVVIQLFTTEATALACTVVDLLSSIGPIRGIAPPAHELDEMVESLSVKSEASTVTCS